MPPRAPAEEALALGAQELGRQEALRAASPPRQGVRDKVLETRSRPPGEDAPPPLASQSRGRAGTDAPRPRPHASPRPPVVSRSTPPSRSAVSSARSPSASAHLRPGTAVGVRTRTTTLKTGEVLVFWLRAMVVSSTHGGYEVVYDGNWPPGDPYGTVRVPRRHVRMVEPSPSPTTPAPSLPPSTAPGSSASDTTATVVTARKEEMRPNPPQPLAGDGAPGPG
ncbi:hypothetical protein C2845_PM03G06870 [Panicum miliaceum]|uniref:Uncharacterized protein n=1 Tax=Panicum miliaceum TaxID=4540 RepID=A0A3L6T6B8_PANMI|nr:hypothetical protein C2845_PM03G06870 [Panicum miliaceum]